MKLTNGSHVYAGQQAVPIAQLKIGREYTRVPVLFLSWRRWCLSSNGGEFLQKIIKNVCKRDTIFMWYSGDDYRYTLGSPTLNQYAFCGHIDGTPITLEVSEQHGVIDFFVNPSAAPVEVLKREVEELISEVSKLI